MRRGPWSEARGPQPNTIVMDRIQVVMARVGPQAKVMLLFLRAGEICSSCRHLRWKIAMRTAKTIPYAYEAQETAQATAPGLHAGDQTHHRDLTVEWEQKDRLQKAPVEEDSRCGEPMAAVDLILPPLPPVGSNDAEDANMGSDTSSILSGYVGSSAPSSTQSPAPTPESDIPFSLDSELNGPNEYEISIRLSDQIDGGTSAHGDTGAADFSSPVSDQAPTLSQYGFSLEKNSS